MVAFHGVDSKVGTTMLIQCIAELIAERDKELKVFLLHLNGRPGTEYANCVGETIEGIKLQLDHKILSKNELLSSCKRTENLFQLGGVTRIGQGRHYLPAAAAYLLKDLEDDFDLILVDTGNDLDNGLAIGALEQIQTRYCILTQQESMLKRYEACRGLYDQLGFHFRSIVVNKFYERDPYSLEYIANRLGFQRESLLKVEATEFARQAEMEYRPMIYYPNAGFMRDIATLANSIRTECQMDPIAVKGKHRWKSFISTNM